MEVVEEGTQSSASQSSSALPSTPSTSSATPKPKHDISFSADKIIEYQWPDNSGQYFFIQEQITEFLGIKSFKRKYPEFYRRASDVEERIFLRDHLIVSEALLNLGLTALRSDDVIELMRNEYPAKYCEYMAAIESRHQAAYSQNVTAGYQPPTIEKSKMGEFIKKAIRSVSEYNQQINQERKDERHACMDLQTYTMHYPIGLGKENKHLVRNIKRGRYKVRRGRYPVATVPGQFQDWYMKYTAEELKYFPLNTVIYGPIVTDPSKLPPLLSCAEDGSPSDSDDSESTPSDDDAGSCCSLSKGATGGEPSTRRSARRRAPSDSSSSDSSSSDSEMEGPPPAPMLMKQLDRGRPNAVCNRCKGTRLFNKSGAAEELVHCSDCANSSHPGCLELTTEMVDVIRSYPWQCSDCKTCVQCGKAHDEDQMMFCDKCDRGYHTFCVGLIEIPTGKWVCRLCAQCAQCGAVSPGSGAAQWQHETIKIISPNGETLRRHQLLCQGCYKQRRK